MIEAGFYGTHDESHPEGLAPGMPSATSVNVLVCLCAAVACLAYHVVQVLRTTIGSSCTPQALYAAASALELLLTAGWYQLYAFTQ